MKLHGNVTLIQAAQQCYVAIDNFIPSNVLPFAISECPKFHKLRQVARCLGPNYTPLNRHLVGEKLMVCSSNNHLQT